jgi:uncharacterized protein involved in outer membrane biogenesis
VRAIRRILQVVTFAGTLMVAVLAVALIVSQTPWFRDWLRRYIVRESKQYLNGQLTIGGLGGNLLFGVDLADVAVDVSGERVVAVKGVELDYNVFSLISKGLVLDQIKIDQPVLQVERDANGWNLARLVKEQAREADREGPMRPISLPSIEIADASISIQDSTRTGMSLPRRLDDVDVRAGFEYAPVHYSVNLEHVSFRGRTPDLSLRQLTGKLAVRDDNLYFDHVTLQTSETSLTVDGVVEQYLNTPVLKLTTTGNVSLPEVGRIVPAAAGYDLHPRLTLKADGTADRLTLDVALQSEAGNVRGRLTGDVQAPDFSARGDVNVDRLNLAPLLKDPAQRSDITGHGRLDVTMKSAPESAPVADRVNGTFAFEAPRVAAAGYAASDVKISGTVDGPRITVDGRASAYGGTATARGFVVTPAPGRALSFDMRGAADHVDLRKLPAAIGVPQLATNLSVADYHISGAGPALEGTATLKESSVEGATIASGTSAEFALAPTTISYAVRGAVRDVDLHRIGGAMKMEALDKPAYDSRINGSFEVAGDMPRTRPRPAASGNEPTPSPLSTMKLDAKGTFADSEIMGGRLPELGFEAHLDRGALTGRAEGRFEGFNPATVAQRKDLEGQVSGTVNATFAVADISAPITPDAITADGRLTLASSEVGGLRIDSADVNGKYAGQIGDVTKLTVEGPDLKVDASGRIALDRQSDSKLTYHVEAVNLAELAKLAGQSDVGGAATLDGTLTGNAASLVTTGTLDGSNLSYGGNSALDLNSKYTVTLPELQAANARVQAVTEATFVKAGGTELNSITATTTYDQKTLDFSTNLKQQTRELDATGQVILHPDHQEIHLPTLAMRTQGVEWRMAPDSQPTIKYGKERIEIEGVRLVSADQSLDVSGTLATGTGTPAGALDVHARNVDLQQLETLMLQNRGFAGKLNADAKVAGSTTAPAIDGKVEIANGSFQNYHYQSFAATVEYEGTRLGLDAKLQQSPTEFVTATGTIPTSLYKASPTGGHVEPTPGDEVELRV